MPQWYSATILDRTLIAKRRGFAVSKISKAKMRGEKPHMGEFVSVDSHIAVI